MPPPLSSESKLARQKRLVTVLGAVLILTGIVVLVALTRLPAPLRMMAGLGDVFIGLVLIVMARQVGTGK